MNQKPLSFWNELKLSISITSILVVAACAPKKEVTQEFYAAHPSATDIVEIVDPCGTNPNINNEVFFRLGSGVLVASFSDSSSGQNTRFVVLAPGSYTTTDGDNCQFTVTSEYKITNENKHY